MIGNSRSNHLGAQGTFNLVRAAEGAAVVVSAGALAALLAARPRVLRLVCGDDADVAVLGLYNRS